MPGWQHLLLLNKRYTIQTEEGELLYTLHLSTLHSGQNRSLTLYSLHTQVCMCTQTRCVCTCMGMCAHACINLHKSLQFLHSIFFAWKRLRHIKPPSLQPVNNLVYTATTGTLHKPSSPPLYRICDVLSANWHHRHVLLSVTEHNVLLEMCISIQNFHTDGMVTTLHGTYRHTTTQSTS